jgi:hypothetical protein
LTWASGFSRFEGEGQTRRAASRLARELLARVQQTGKRLTSPLAVWEAAVAVARVLDLSVSAGAEAVEDHSWPRLLSSL